MAAVLFELSEGSQRVCAATLALALGGASRQVVAAAAAAGVRAVAEWPRFDDSPHTAPLDPAVEEELEARLCLAAPCLAARIAGEVASGAQRAARNVAMHARLGEGAAVLPRTGTEAKRLQRGGRARRRPVAGGAQQEAGQSTDDAAELSTAGNSVGEEQMCTDVNKVHCDMAGYMQYRDDDAAKAPGMKQMSIGVNVKACDTAHEQSPIDKVAIEENPKQYGIGIFQQEKQESIDVNELHCDMAIRKQSLEETAIEVDVKQMGIGVNKMACDTAACEQSNHDEPAASERNVMAMQLLLKAGLDAGTLFGALTELPVAMLRGTCTARGLCSRGSRQAFAKRLAADVA